MSVWPVSCWSTVEVTRLDISTVTTVILSTTTILYCFNSLHRSSLQLLLSFTTYPLPCWDRRYHQPCLHSHSSHSSLHRHTVQRPSVYHVSQDLSSVLCPQSCYLLSKVSDGEDCPGVVLAQQELLLVVFPPSLQRPWFLPPLRGELPAELGPREGLDVALHLDPGPGPGHDLRHRHSHHRPN